MVRVDPRNPRNQLAQAQADLEVAKAQLTNATSQKRRADALFKTQSITEQEHETALLDYANAKANVVRAKVAVETAKDQLDDTNVLAPITGTIIEKDVERGQVISSPTKDVGRRHRTAQDGRPRPGAGAARWWTRPTSGRSRSASPPRSRSTRSPTGPFEGSVLKIEPQAQTEQNVTMFPVLVRIDNRAGLLRPGMNAEVEIHVGDRDNVLAVPNAALRTQRDVGSAAQVLGLSPDDVTRELAAPPGHDGDVASRCRQHGASAARTPPGASRQRVAGGRPMRTRGAGAGRRGGGGGGATSRYIVFVKRGGPPLGNLDQNRPHRHGLQRSPVGLSPPTRCCSCRARAWCSRSRTCRSG